MKKKKSNKVLDHLFMLFLIGLLSVGLLLLLSPMIRSMIIREATTDFTLRNFTMEEIVQNHENAEDIPWDPTIAPPSLATVVQGINHINRADVLGAVVVSELNIKLPILNGSTSENLLIGATTVNHGQVMGEGNYVLSGHHMRDQSLLFSQLLNAEKGMLIQLTDKRNIYTYEVNEIKLIHETDVHILEESEKPIVTLFTCDVSGVNTDRRHVVIGELVDVSPYVPDEADNEFTEMFRTQEEQMENTTVFPVIWMIVLLVAGVTVLVYGLYFIMTRKSKTS